MTEQPSVRTNRNVIFLVIVASLGYFVDIYDLLIFSIVRKASLLSIGVKPADILDKGLMIITGKCSGCCWAVCYGAFLAIN